MLQASVLIASPGTAIYSVLGHAALRLQFSDGTTTLDYTFTSEGQDVGHNLLEFFAGRLQMATMRVLTSEYTAQYTQEGRTVEEIPLALSDDCIRTLWQQMDERVITEANLPYDFMNRSCAQCVYQWITTAETTSGTTATSTLLPPPEEYAALSRNEIAGQQISDPWAHFFLQTFIGGEGYSVDIPTEQKIITPRDLITALRLEEAERGERAGISEDTGKSDHLSHPAFSAPEPSLATTLTSPTAVSALLLVASMLVAYKSNWATRCSSKNTGTGKAYKAARLACLGLTATPFAAISLFVTYLVLFSDLPCTSWNWLIIPFNPLPLLFWHWRRKWAKPYLAMVVIWSLGMVLAPHHLVDTAHILLALAWAITILSTGISNRDSTTRRPERPMTSVAQGKRSKASGALGRQSAKYKVSP